MVALQTEDLFFEITTKLAENVGFPYKKLFFFEIAPSVKSLPLQNFACPPQNYVLAMCHIFLNDVIFAKKSQAVQILYISLFFETES